jgi:hypothetical protein
MDPVQGAALINRVLGKQIQPTDLETLRTHVQDKAVKDAVVKHLATYARQAKLNG